MSFSNLNIPIWLNRYAVRIILAISLLLRWILVLRGGQYYFSDEGRYETSRSFVELAISGNFTEAFSQLFTAPEHVGFKIIGILPALAERITRESLVLPALFFSIFSVLNLLLIYLISRKAGASDKESLYALIFAATSMSLLYFSRHIMPYDPAMTFGLLAISTALAEKQDFKTSLTCGALGFACFITYNGYWALAGVSLLVHILQGNPSWSGIFKKGFVTAIGFTLPAILLFAIASVSCVDILQEYRTFAATVSQGSFEEGWSLPLEYFWHAEHLVFVAFALLSVYALIMAKGKNKSHFLWASAVLFIYFCLAIPSTFTHSFVVYGRLARQMMPFLVLLSAAGFSYLEGTIGAGRRTVQILLTLILIQAAWNYAGSFRLSYPREFAAQAQTLYPEFTFSEKRLIFGAPTLCQNNGYIAEYIKRFDIPPDANPSIAGEILLASPHPDTFLPYQYEGYTYEQRQALRELKPEMRLYRADPLFVSESNLTWKSIKNCFVNEN
jgi:hypothetical protein